ncbi:MAG: ADP-ribosylglycohydrolase family protein [Flavitalea sp.]
MPINKRFETIRSVSSLTHAHVRSVIACFYYVEFAIRLIKKADKFTAYADTAALVKNYLKEANVSQHEISIFDRLLTADISTETEETIFSAGYVLHTLEASIWCLLTSDNYSEAVLKAVNLGQDTDTTAAVTGGLAALAFGFDNIPTKWIQMLARKDDIADLADRLSSGFS